MYSLGLTYQEFFKMLEERTIASMARIEVQQSFCNTCSACIKKKLQDIKDLKNIRLYPRESLITFNFIKANKLSDALNILSEIGYPERGESMSFKQTPRSACQCIKSDMSNKRLNLSA